MSVFWAAALGAFLGTAAFHLLFTVTTIALKVGALRAAKKRIEIAASNADINDESGTYPAVGDHW